MEDDMTKRKPQEEELMYLFTTALPISQIDQMVYPGVSTALIWVDLSDRPDLQVLASQGDLNTDKMFICTMFYVMPTTPMMGIGLRVKMHESPHLTFSLVFPLKYDFDVTTQGGSKRAEQGEDRGEQRKMEKRDLHL